MKEQEKYEIIKKLVETSGNKDSAALKLSVSRRQINRMMKGYKAFPCSLYPFIIRLICRLFPDGRLTV